MRTLLILMYICIISVLKAQSVKNNQETEGFIGREFMFNTTGAAHGIYSSDSTTTVIGLEGVNYFGIDDLNTYGLNLARIHRNTGYKLSYRNIRENVFDNHEITLGLQKRISKVLEANVMLGTKLWSYSERSTTGLMYSLALRYRSDSRIQLHQEISVINQSGSNQTQALHSAVLYTFSPQYSALIQLDYQGTFDGRIGILLHNNRFRVQVSHQFHQNRIELGVGFKMTAFTINVLYSYHEVLGGTSYANIQFRL